MYDKTSGQPSGWYKIFTLIHDAYHPYSFLSIYFFYASAYDQFTFSNLIFGTESIEGAMNRCKEVIINQIPSASSNTHIESAFKYISKVGYKQTISYYLKFDSRGGTRRFTYINKTAENTTTTKLYYDIGYTELTDSDMDIRYYDGQLVTS